MLHSINKSTSDSNSCTDIECDLDYLFKVTRAIKQ